MLMLYVMGKKLIAFRGQNHQAHIDAHRAFMSSFLVKGNPQATMAILQAHIWSIFLYCKLERS